MKLTVEFPSIVYREGPANVARLAKGIEDIGYDQLDIFDHVVMGFDGAGSFYADPGRVAARAADLRAMGFDGVALNATMIFQSGARSVDAILDTLQTLHDRLRAEVG
jgi:alkanesulfonate monooxygenase SsuD/methylene tetrahydromethanopterin reductase-like flavin-dependent oxidoreductase (luciferase family)